MPPSFSPDEYDEDGGAFLTVDIQNGWAAAAFNDWDDGGRPYAYQPVNRDGGEKEDPVYTGGQTPAAARNALRDTDLAAECARRFAVTG